MFVKVNSGEQEGSENPEDVYEWLEDRDYVLREYEQMVVWDNQQDNFFRSMMTDTSCKIPGEEAIWGKISNPLSGIDLQMVDDLDSHDLVYNRGIVNIIPLSDEKRQDFEETIKNTS